MEVTNDALNAVNKYFQTISKLGYKKDSEVNSLIIFLFLEEFLCNYIIPFIRNIQNIKLMVVWS